MWVLLMEYNNRVAKAIEMFSLDELGALESYMHQLKLQDPEAYWIAHQELEQFIFEVQDD